MQPRTYTGRALFPLGGIIATLCLAMLVFFGAMRVQLPHTTPLPVAGKAVNVVASFKTKPAVLVSSAHNKSQSHFSVRHKNFVKLVMKKGSPSMVGIFEWHFAKAVAGNILPHPAFIPPSGCALFLFRYALF